MSVEVAKKADDLVTNVYVTNPNQESLIGPTYEIGGIRPQIGQKVKTWNELQEEKSFNHKF